MLGVILKLLVLVGKSHLNRNRKRFWKITPKQVQQYLLNVFILLTRERGIQARVLKNLPGIICLKKINAKVFPKVSDVYQLVYINQICHP